MKRVLILLIIILTAQLSAAEDNPLSIFNKLTGKDWVGHYDNPEDSHYVHKVKFSFDLDSMIVTHTKNVDELKYESETKYYYDPAENIIRFISFMNKRMFSKGKIEIDGNKIILVGELFFEGGSSLFKNSYEIDSDGNLIDRFYINKNDEYVQRHLIIYKPF